MLKKISINMVVAFLLIAPVMSFAQTTPQTPTVQTLIQQLQEQIKALQQQVVSLQSQLTATKQEVAEVKTELKLTRSLQRGARGDDVKELQRFLAGKFPDLFSDALITGYYGAKTEAAVKKLQEEQGIESIGVVGPKTLSRVNELLTQGAGNSGVIPPGLLTAPGIQRQFATTSAPTIVSTSTATTPLPFFSTSTPIVVTTTATSTAIIATTTTIVVPPPTVATPPTISTTPSPTQTITATTTSSSYGSALNFGGISNTTLFSKIWGPGSNGIVIGGGLNFSTQTGIGWSQQYGGKYVTSYSIQGVSSSYLTQTNPINVVVSAAAGSVTEVWDLENLTVVATNYGAPGPSLTFTAQPNHRYGGFAWYINNSQQDIAIYAAYSSSSTTATSTTPTTSTATSTTATSTAADTTAPSVPTGLTTTAVSTIQIDISWSASTDNVGVAGYKVYRNGTQITSTVGSSTIITYPDIGLTAGTTYTYTVAAFDAAGNVSAQSSSVSGTTKTTPVVATNYPACEQTVKNVPGSYATIQAAIDAANAGDTVKVAAGTYSGLVRISKSICLEGAGIDQTMIVNNSNVGIMVEAAYVIVKNLTVTGSNDAIGGIPSNGMGGGIFTYNTNHVTIQSCRLTQNTAYNGGGLYANHTTDLVVDHCLIDNNHATNMAGGAYVEGASNGTFTNVTITNNTADRQIGGFGYAIDQGTGSRNLTISNSIFYGNTGPLGGYNTGSTNFAIYWTTTSPTATVGNSDVGGWSGGSGNIDADPKFVSTSDYHLQAASPASGMGIYPNPIGLLKDAASSLASMLESLRSLSSILQSLEALFR